MASYKAINNPFTGNLTLIRSDSAFHLKDSVATYNDLPITGNTENDVRITQDDDKMYTWGISASSGLLTDWKVIGSSSSVDWSAITGKPSSTPAEIDSAVLVNHTQDTDQKLDNGGVNEVVVADIKDAVTKKHTQNTDTDLDVTFEATFVKKLDNINVLADISSSGANIEEAVTKKHTQNTDEDIVIDSTPASDHSASGIKSSFTAGEAVVFGDVCYIKSDGKMWKADASVVATSYCVAMALTTISTDALGSFLLIGVARDDTWTWTVGSPVYLSITAGTITQTAPSGSGEIVQILGIATHADRMYFKPELVQVEIA